MKRIEKKETGKYSNNFLSLYLPDYFTTLLKEDIHKKGPLGHFLNSYILERPGFHGIMLKLFTQKEFGKNLDSIITSIGWYTLRAQIAALFISYKQNGFFPEDVDPSCVDELLMFEEKIKPFTVEGYSRGLLFAFYLKMCEIEDENSKKLFGPSIITFLSKIKVKTVKIDWILFILYQFNLHLGEEKVGFFLNSNYSFQKIMDSLDSYQKKTFFMDGLSYAFSINDKETLTNLVC
jgi:hypothetical protein